MNKQTNQEALVDASSQFPSRWGTCYSGTISFLFARCRYLSTLRFSLTNSGKGADGWGRARGSHRRGPWRPTTGSGDASVHYKRRQTDTQTHTHTIRPLYDDDYYYNLMMSAGWEKEHQTCRSLIQQHGRLNEKCITINVTFLDIFTVMVKV